MRFAWLILILALSSAAFASIPANERAKEMAQAPENSPVIDENWDLERVDFVHYARPPSSGKPGGDACYKLMGVKWNEFPVTYAINPSNPYGLSESFITSSLYTSAETWDDFTSRDLFGLYSVDYSAQYGVQDYKNSIAFGDYGDSNAIAVTSVWYTRIGKQIVEFDMIFNTRFVWGDASANSALMDLQNIATHELGHSVGLADIYNTACSSVTMYGYSGYGELDKRTLEQADVTGLQKMYGI